MSDPTGAIPFADLRLGEIVWTCEHPNGADHNAHATFNDPPRNPRAMIVTEPQAAPHKNVFLAAIAPDTGKPIHVYDSSVTLYSPSRQFAFRDKAACDAYYREAVAQWAILIRHAVDEVTRACAVLGIDQGGGNVNEEIRAVGIAFGDNDFHNTFCPLLKVLQLALYEEPTMTRERITRCINALTPGCYTAFQYAGTKEADAQKIAYLRVPESKVLINDEVDAHLRRPDSEMGWNGEFYFMHMANLGEAWSK